VPDRVHDERQDQVPARLDDRGVEGPVERLRGLRVVGFGDPRGGLPQVIGLFVGATRRGEPGRLAEHQRTRLHQVLQRAVVEPAGAEQQVRQDVEAARGAPVGDAHRIAVPDLDQPQLLEPLHGLADRRHVHAQVAGERALRGQLLAGLVGAAEDALGQPPEDVIGDEHTTSLPNCSEQFSTGRRPVRGRRVG
jgi:hypothetical protein